jgi:chitodextrinase
VNRWLDFGTRNIDTLPPSVPKLPRILATTTTSATIEWDPSVDQSTAITYRIYARTADGSTTVTDAGAATASTLSGLTPRAQYFFAIDATDPSGNVSARGAEQSVVLPAPPIEETIAPSPPTKLSITGVRGEGPGHAGTGHSSNLVTGTPDARSPTRLAVSGIKGTMATLLWSPGTGGGTVTSYRILLKDEATGSLRSMTTAGNERSAAIALPAGYVTTIRVVAVAAAGSAPSAPIKAVGSRSAAGCTWVAGDRIAPTRPRGVTLVARLTTALGVRWASSFDKTGVCAYRRVKLVRSRWVMAGPPVAVRPLTTTIRGLRRGTAQRVAIQAIDASGNLSSRAEIVSRTR